MKTSIRPTLGSCFALCVVVTFAITGCGGSASAEDASASNEAPVPVAPAEVLPVEEIVSSIQFSGAKLTVENAAQAKAAVQSGMPIRKAVEAVGAIAGAPNQAGSGVANWLARTDDGGCLNLMLMTGDGVVRNASLDTFPKGSMGEAKCQNYGL